MKRSLVRAAVAATVTVAALIGTAMLTPAVAAPSGSGPYPADWTTTSALPNHTVYRPANLPTAPMPVVVWSNGACSADGTSAQNFLREIASHGFLVISNGRPGGSGSSTSTWLTQAMDWAVAENSRWGSPLQGRIDTAHIGVAGFSCGGLEAYAVSGDPRVSTTAIFSSGLLNQGDVYQLRRLDHPIAYVIGGPSDIAYQNAMRDWGNLPSGLPAFMGNLNVGHGGTYHETNGGEFGRVAQLWFRWQLMGDTEAGRAFVGADCGLCRAPWTIQQKNLVLADPEPEPEPEPDPDPEPEPDPEPDPAACTATYRVENQWPGGFVASVQVDAVTALDGWTVGVQLPSGAVSHAWNGTSNGTGSSVTVTNTPWNGALAAGQGASFGFQGTGIGAGATVTCQPG